MTPDNAENTLLARDWSQWPGN